MIKYIYDGGVPFFQGLSTDEKPKGVSLNGAIFYEMDTQNIYMYDEQNDRWILQ